MSTLGLIGSGHIGSTLARLGVTAGLDVVLSNSRGPGTLAELVAELGPRARAADTAEAAAAGDWVVVTVPLGNYRRIPVEPLAGKVVLDTGNYYPERDGRIAELDAEETTTSELLQRHLPGAKVVKAFNSIYYANLAALARPSGAADRSALPIAGDDPGARAAAVRLLDLLGYDAVDTGPLADSWRFQRYTPAYVAPYARDPRGGAAATAGGSVSPDDPGAPLGADSLRALLAQARRPTGAADRG
ncbi:NAD(P)-binding domain-containing protein [Streptomyces sp. NPDC046887]|uniref:NADPH-dependent F420 reductase n=1 Tax=Streptomyces sp. NPDC046887 TaxID=3155472 RepID=UPI0033D6ED2B